MGSMEGSVESLYITVLTKNSSDNDNCNHWKIHLITTMTIATIRQNIRIINSVQYC